ncbi:TrbC/VirB2 family protein [Candidatus Saccharibacteria bacterium]|nr:TrbC/VirB2 family protein [Candidatus Saccharibacteria bacterium]
MKKIAAAISSILIAFCSLVAPTIATSPVFADYDGAIIDAPDGEEGIKHVLNLAVDILSVVIGIVAVIGIVIVGIQYLTAGGNEEQTRKAKRRLFEIVIGIVAYVLMYALLKWLLPGFEAP